MWAGKGLVEKNRGTRNGIVAVAIDKDKGSQYALRWAADNLLSRGQTVVLIQVQNRSTSASVREGSTTSKHDRVKQNKDLFLPFHCYCTRKDISCLDVVLEDANVASAIADYVSYAAIEVLVVGASSRNGFIRLKASNIPSDVMKEAPDFCTVYVISKGKVSASRNASRPAPHESPLVDRIGTLSEEKAGSEACPQNSLRETTWKKPLVPQDEPIKSAFDRGRGPSGYATGYNSEPDTDISFISSGRPSTDRASSTFYESFDSVHNARISCTSADSSPRHSSHTLTDLSSMYGFSSISQESGRTSCSFSSQNMEDVEAEMRRLKLELKQTMEMYSTACKEALTAKQTAVDLQCWRLKEERKLEEARLTQEAALAMAEKERAKCKAAVEAAEAAQRIAELEAQRRVSAEMKALKEAEETKKTLGKFPNSDVNYRRYTIEEIESATNFFASSCKIGEGGYGPVFKCYLDHTSVAVKVLRPDAAQGMSQFQQEVEILSRIRHPNMVLLLGACPEYGCLVYEYMANGSLEDCLFHQGKAPVLSWQLRFHIAAEIATGLMFLHQTKPEPLVHRDLKPANILLDANYVSKISDVGLARLVPPSVAENVTQYRMTSTAGTFCYIDPEYQQTGMLGVKSDVYSLGIILLQLITAKPPMGITYFVSDSLEKENISEVLDPDVADWPVEEATRIVELGLKCAELRRKDRPDLGKVVLPELCRLRDFAQGCIHNCSLLDGTGTAKRSPAHYPALSAPDVQQEVMSVPLVHSASSTNYSDTSVKTIS